MHAQPGVVAHICNPRTQEVEWRQKDLEVEDGLGYTVSPTPP
jgi:hypothetical protein